MTGQATMRRHDRLVVFGAFITTALILGLGGRGAVVAIAVAVLPMSSFVLAGHMPGRGGVVGCLALALGAATVPPASAGVPWGSLLVLGLVAAAATLGAAMADRLAPRPMVAGADGRWLTVVVSCDGPADTTGIPARPTGSPRRDVERRRLTRLVRRRAAQVTVGA
jgi:hypothetical protein